MALKKTIEAEAYGEALIFEEAYHQVLNISGSKQSLTFTLVAFKDETKEIVINSKSFVFIPSDDEQSLRWDKQCYEYAKSLQEYADAVDC